MWQFFLKKGGLLLYLGIRREFLKKLIKEKGWSKKEFAEILGVNYAHLYRILKGDRNPGNKFFSGLLDLCKKEKIEFEDYVFIKKRKKD
jgi:transcriptional regulator with XRE-family HTH domain